MAKSRSRDTDAVRLDRQFGGDRRGRRRRYVIVEAAVLVIHDEQQSLVPSGTRDDCLDDPLAPAPAR